MKSYPFWYCWLRRMSVVGMILLMLLQSHTARPQNRIRDENAIGWYTYFGDNTLSQKWELHTEYQWRRIDFIRSWQQSLARVGFIYTLAPKVKTAAGYTLLLGFPYGTYPESEPGVPNPEHRLYEDLELTDTVWVANLTHRFRLEQRWLSTWDDGPRGKTLGWQYQNRIRYRIQARLPLRGRTIDNGEPYLSLYDELFMGFGRQVALDIFDQNRLYAGLGYRVNEQLRLEAGYLNQILQHAEPETISQKPIMEHNHGFTISVYLDLNFSKR